MKRISTWALHNKWQARILIISSWIMLTFLGVYIGITLKEINAVLPGYVLFGSIVAFIATYTIYPLKKQQKIKCIISFYAWRKSCDLLLASASFVMVIYVANKPEVLLSGYQNAFALVINKTALPEETIRKPYKSISDFTSSLKDKDGNLLKWKERKKLLRTQVKAIQKSDNTSKGEKTALIILSVLVAIGLLALVSAAACSLSCNGSEAAALIVGIGGAALVVWLLIYVIGRINGKVKKKQIKPESTEMPIQ